MSAVSKVLNTTELVELILLQDLPIKDVLRSQRVNPFFKAVFTNSKPLRRATFLEPDPISRNVRNNDHLFENSDTPPQQPIVRKIHPFILRSDYHTLTSQGELFPLWRGYTAAQLDSVHSQLVCQPPCTSFRISFKRVTPLYELPNLDLVVVWKYVVLAGNTIGPLIAKVEQLEGGDMEIMRIQIAEHNWD
jgi:hypothetical protein